MDKDILEKYKKAGRINAEVKQAIRKMAKLGVKIIEIAEMTEKLIAERGAKPAFPLNISFNDIAAHYTPVHGDTKVIGEGDLVKFDVGVHVDGYIADSAFTYCSEKNALIDCAEKAVDAAVAVIRPGIPVMEIGDAIDEVMREFGFGLIVNLTGHGVDQYVFHAHPTIPNVKNQSRIVLEEGQAIAIEPFVVPSTGHARDAGQAEIYRYAMDRPVRLPEARQILAMARDEFQQLPFAKRWLYRHFSPVKVSLALRQLEALGTLESYPPLKESRGQPVAQCEHTIIVMEKSIVTTAMDAE